MQEKIMLKCDLCGKQYQHGPHRYEGHHCRPYGIGVCGACWEGNWDGWNPRLEPILLDHLRKNGLPVPERNAKGWFPRD
jgi:hypothetical protein